MGDGFEDLEEQRLRRAFRLIGDEVGRAPGGVGARNVATARRPRWRVPVAGALGAVVAVSAGVLAVTVLNDAGTGISGEEEAASAGRGQTLPEAIACARTIVEGEVTSVEQAGEPHTVTLSIAVREWIKPDSGDPTVRMTVQDPAHVDQLNALEAGTDILIMVPERPSDQAAIYEGDQIPAGRSEITRDLPEAEYTECPPEWRDTDDTAE